MVAIPAVARGRYQGLWGTQKKKFFWWGETTQKTHIVQLVWWVLGGSNWVDNTEKWLRHQRIKFLKPFFTSPRSRETERLTAQRSPQCTSKDLDGVVIRLV